MLSRPRRSTTRAFIDPAPLMAVGVERRAKTVAAKLDQPLILQPASNAMPYNPLAQSPDAAFPVPETTTPGVVEDRPGYYTARPGEASPQLLKQRRRASKEKTATIRRSSSTPHMRNLPLGTSSELSPTGDKRRNKLGYHRTSVACGHCRRRKIRCLVANDEVTGRCANCIRLKKDCNFYPVDQAPEAPRPHAGVSKDAAGLPSSNTSSPRHPTSILGSKVDEFRPPFPGTVPTSTLSMYEVPSESESESHQITPTSGMPVQQPSFGYPPPIETQWPPTTGFLPSSAVSESPSSSVGYWRPSPSAATSGYGSDVSGVHTPATISTSSTMSFSNAQDNSNWAPTNFQPPTRSMSYGNIEGLPQHFQNHSLGTPTHEYRRTGPYTYPTTLDTSSSIMNPTTLGSNTSAPLSAPIVSGNPYNHPSAWNPYGGGSNPVLEGHLPGRSIGGQWYTEPSHLGQVQEEGAQPMTFSHHGVSQY